MVYNGVVADQDTAVPAGYSAGTYGPGVSVGGGAVGGAVGGGNGGASRNGSGSRPGGQTQYNETPQYVCFKCRRAIPKLDEGVMAANRFYHINCFTCTRCQLGLAHVDFYNVGEFVFCTQCYLRTKKM